MKKRIAMGAVFAGLMMSAVLCGCAGEQLGIESSKDASSSAEQKPNEKKFVIASAENNNITTYVVDSETNRTTRSMMQSGDETVLRSYTYSDSGELSEVRSTSSLAGTSVIKYYTASNRADSKKTRKTISVTGTRGDKDVIEVEYIYVDDGAALGVIQTDSNGNIYAKGVER